MAGEWPVQRLPDLLTLQRGHDLPSDKRVAGEFPVVAATGQVGFHYEAKCDAPGVVIGRSGSIGGAQWIAEPFWPLNTTLYVIDFKGNNPYFCYSVLKSIDFRPFNAGSGVPTLNRNHLADIEVPAISRAEQDRIAHLLYTLDAKVDLNRQMAATLEDTARALFKSWFVDFDPVHARSEGRDTGLPADIAALFPDGFNDDGFPTGWTSGTPESLVEINPTTRINRGAEAPYIDMAALPTQGPRITSVVPRHVGSGSKFMNGDTLLARITPCLENGKTALVDCLADGEVAWGSTEFIVMRPKESIPASLPYLIARDAAFRAHVIAAMSGTSGRQRAPAEAVGRWSMAIPTEAVISAWGEAVLPIFEGIKANSLEAENLVALRDLLLPKLLSGGLQLPDAETAIAAA